MEPEDFDEYERHIAEVRVEERERCAKIAESLYADVYAGGTEREAGRAIAAAIRNLNN